jgi:transcriptional regulator with XRE-family HTH domain
MTITLAQVRAARKLLGWSIVKTAVQTNVGNTLIERFERGQRELRPEVLAHLRSAFETAGIEFTKSSARSKKPPG